MTTPPDLSPISDIPAADARYLWNRDGDAPADVQRLEDVLGSLRSRRSAPDLGDVAHVDAIPAPAPWRTWAAAAALLLAIVAPWIASRLTAPSAHWDVSWLSLAAGEPRPATLRTGEWLDTGAGRARIAVGAIGTIDLGPGSRVHLVDAGTTHHRLALARGTMRATIWAPPGQFLVDTPSALAVDLGCQYTLHITEGGAGELRVEVGWVGFAHGGRRVLVPAGAGAATRPGVGPGTPYLDDVPPAMREALDVIDFGPGRGVARAEALATVLAAARDVDALTLWHLLARVERSERGQVFDRFAHLVPPPPPVSRDGIMRGDAAMLDAWWDSLGLGATADWREWTTPWPASAAHGTR